ncbi:MAG TPA: hypothetical protein VKA31_09700 [Mariprofundaceae bacterium]|nr:hypothetical protein [Mariprofundaceae bacterium]
MIRNILVAIVFFFGPALLMFMLRNGILLFRLWLFNRRQRAMQPEVIDITPVPEKKGASRWFYLLAFLLGLATAVSAFMYLQTADSEPRHYVPAHVGSDGKVVPGKWTDKP